MAFTDTLLHQISTGGAPLGCAFSTCRSAGADASSSRIGVECGRMTATGSSGPAGFRVGRCVPQTASWRYAG
jgi:hypothetical protein